MTPRILVPLDGSVFAEHALPYAAVVARVSQAPLHLCHAFEPIPATYPSMTPVVEPVASTEEIEWVQNYLERTAGRIAGRVDVPVSTELVVGSPLSGLMHVVRSGEYGMVVMTSHGRGGLARSWLGSVADSMVRNARLPVLVVRPGEGAADLEAQPSLQNILVPLDGSGTSAQALPIARNLAELTHGRISLLIISGSPAVFGYPSVPLGGVLEPDAEASLQDYLATVARDLAPANVRGDVRVAPVTDFAATILREARAQHSDLIVMATHGRSGLRRAMLGSVADKVLRGSTIPVLLYRPRRKTGARRRALLEWRVPEIVI